MAGSNHSRGRALTDLERSDLSMWFFSYSTPYHFSPSPLFVYISVAHTSTGGKERGREELRVLDQDEVSDSNFTGNSLLVR